MKMSGYSYFGVNRSSAVAGLPQQAFHSTVNMMQPIPRSYPKLPSLTRLGYNVSARLQEHANAYHVGHTAGLSSIEHAFQPIDSKKFASAWAEIRAGHTIPRLRDFGTDRTTASMQNLFDQRRTDAGSNLSGGRFQSNSIEGVLLAQHGTSPSKQYPSRSESSLLRQGRNGRLAPLSGSTAKASGPSTAKSKGTSGAAASSGPATSGRTTTEQSDSVASGSLQAAAAHRQPHPKPRLIPQKEAQRYMQAKLAYLIEYNVEKKRRKEKFLKQLRAIAEKAAEMHNQTLENFEARRRDGRLRQERQLMSVRNKFDSKRKQRLMRQHVAKNALLSYDQNRAAYGLPETYASKTTFSTRLRPHRRGQSAEPIDEQGVDRMYSRLSHRYTKLFSIPVAPTFNPRAVTPKMEGYDTVEVAVFSKTGNTKKKQVLVGEIVKDAVSTLKASSSGEVDDMPLKAGSDTIPTLPLHGTHDQEDDDEDIFERLFRKYNIIVEDD